MASLLATPPTSTFLHPNGHQSSPRTQPRQGILLNRNDVSPLSTPQRSPIALPSPLPRNNSNTSSNSSGASRRSNSPPRKIRFAPLPEPRRAVLVTEAGEVIPDTSAQPPAQDVAAAGELIALTPVTSISGNSTGNGDDSDSRTETGSVLGASAKKKSKKWGKRLLGPLLKGNTSSEKEDSSAVIWRQTSRDSVQSNGSVHEVGFPLGRRKSTGSAEPSGRGRAPLIGSPLTITRSAEGGGTAPVRQQRMLNGRVYGARQSLQSATVEEPEFVEWGYGGMGSVNSSGGSQYARLQSSNKLSLGTEASTADEDDGSGMAWVAKRRAAREEKARKEKEAALEAERAKQALKEEEPTATQITGEANLPQPDGEDTETRPQTPTPASNKPSMPPTPHRSSESRASDATSPPSSLTYDHEEHHFVKTVSIPGAHPRPHHPRNQSIASLKELATSPTRHASPPSPERGSEHGSTTEEDDEDDEDATEDSDTELEEDMEEEERKTALCAGVEKVSRHT